MTANLSEQKADEGVGREDLSASIDDLLAKVRKRERDLIAGWVAVVSVEPVQHTLDWPMWRRLLWSALHPVRFYKAAVIADIAIGIDRGRYLESAAAQAIEARSAKTEGLGPQDESAVPSGMRPPAAPGVHP